MTSFFRLAIVQAAASFTAWAVALRHPIHTHDTEEGEALPAVFVLPLAGAPLWRLELIHAAAASSREGVGCVEVRILGCAVEVFYRPRLEAAAA